MLDQRPLRGRQAVSARLVTACCSWLVCSPPPLAADTPAKRLADRLLPRPGWLAGAEAATYLIGGSSTFGSSDRPTPTALPSTPPTVSAAGATAAQQSSSPAADQDRRLP